MHVLQVEPKIKTNFVAAGLVSLAFSHVLDHGNPSRIAHRAAECAGKQSPLAFWQMHDLLFERQAQLWNTTPDLLISWAEELGLDGTIIASCMADPMLAEQVEAIDQERRTQGIRIRPSFIMNDRLIEGAIPYERFVQLFADFGAEPVK